MNNCSPYEPCIIYYYNIFLFLFHCSRIVIFCDGMIRKKIGEGLYTMGVLYSQVSIRKVITSGWLYFLTIHFIHLSFHGFDSIVQFHV